MSRAERERQMLDVAEQVFGERGYQGTSMDEIAERCGVSKPMLYEYFGSKDGLLVACVGRSKAELLDVTQKAMAGATDPEDILWRGMVAYFGFIDAHSKSFAMLLREPAAGSQEAVEAVEATRRQQSELISGVLAAFAPQAGEPAIAAFTGGGSGSLSESAMAGVARHFPHTAVRFLETSSPVPDRLAFLVRTLHRLEPAARSRAPDSRSSRDSTTIVP